MSRRTAADEFFNDSIAAGGRIGDWRVEGDVWTLGYNTQIMHGRVYIRFVPDTADIADIWFT